MPAARFPHQDLEALAEQSEEPPSAAVAEAEPPHSPVFPDYFLKRRLPSGSPRTDRFRRLHFPGVSVREWNDWHWQMRNRVRTPEQLERMLVLSDAERAALGQGGELLPFGVTPYYMSLLDSQDPMQPLRRTVVPVHMELLRTAGEADDPLGEDDHSPVSGIVHRYVVSTFFQRSVKSSVSIIQIPGIVCPEFHSTSD